MAFTQAQLNAIEEAIASGTTSVSYEGKTVTYQDLDHLLRVRNIIMRSLGLINGSSTVFAAHDRGFGGWEDGAFDSTLLAGR